MFTTTKVISLLLGYKYVLLFPLAVIEGPIITILAGFFVTTGVFNPILVYMLVVLGDAFGDSVFYFLGRGGGKVLHRFFKKSMDPKKMDEAKKYFTDHRKKALIVSKLAHGIGITGLVAAGTLKVNYGKFFTTCLVVSLIQSAIFLILGIVFGHAYIQLGKYLGYFGIAVAILALSSSTYLIIKFKARLR